MPLKLAQQFEKLKIAFRRYRSASSRHVSLFTLQLIAIVAIFGIAILFMTRTLNQTNDKILQERNSIIQFQRRIDSLNQLRELYHEIEGKLPGVYGLLTAEEELGDRIDKLDKLNESFALKASIKIGAIEQSAIHFTINTTASIDTLKRYLLALEELPFLVNVQSVHFSGAHGQPGSVGINANFYPPPK